MARARIFDDELRVKRVSSINLKTSTSNAFTHNDRTLSPSYLLDKEDSKGIECNRTATEAQELYKQLREEAFGNYTERTGQKVQTAEEKLRWSAVVNLNENHTLEDVENLAKKLEEKYGWQSLQVAIHRDEGYKDKEGKTHYNHHAHLEFFMLDKEGIYRFKKRDFGMKKMSDLQTEVAEVLGMERGKPKRETKRERFEHRQYREVAKEREADKEIIAELKKEKSEIEYNFRDTQKKITALETENIELKKELHRLNTQANKTKDTEKIAELNEKIELINARFKTETVEVKKGVLKSEIKEVVSVEEAKRVTQELLIQEQRSDTLQRENERLRRENEILSGENKTLKTTLDKLTKSVKTAFEKFLPRRKVKEQPEALEKKNTVAEFLQKQRAKEAAKSRKKEKSWER